MKKNIIILFSLILMFSSCDQDLLDIQELGVVSESSYYKTDDDALSAITVVYQEMLDAFMADFFLKNLLADDVYCGGGSRGDRTYYEALNAYNFSADNQTVEDAFSAYYQVIKYANVVIENFPEDSETNTDAKDICRAEAKLARAWAHMQLTALWGTPPLIDHVLSNSDEYKQPNSTQEELWGFIITDLTEAATVLPSKTDVSEQVVRFTKGAALSLKGKAEVLSGDYSAAKSTLKEVINSGLYGLVSDMSTLFNGQGDFCAESILEMNKVWNATSWSFNSLHLYTNPRADNIYLPTILYGRGYGFMNPTADFYTAFKAHDGESSHRINSWIKTWEQMLDMEYSGDNGLIASYIYAHEGYFDWKMACRAEDVPSASWGYYSSANKKYMRYAEVLLLYAEACAQDGDSDGSGLAALNEVQGRAGSPLTALSLENIKEEMRFELWMEGTRFIDLVRWGDAATTLAEQGAYIPTFDGVDGEGNYIVDTDRFTNNTYGFVSNKHELLPFPAAEIISNSNITQNPGWSSESE